MDFHWSLNDSKFHQCSRTLLSILAILNNAISLDGFHSSSTLQVPLVTVTKAPITIGTIDTFMFPSVFQFPSKFEVLIHLFPFFQFYSVVSWDSSVNNFANSPFMLYYQRFSFTSALADAISLEIEWQQVSSSLQDSSQYSGRFQ